jgi:DNA-binding NarL/FixJ family response regulator
MSAKAARARSASRALSAAPVPAAAEACAVALLPVDAALGRRVEQAARTAGLTFVAAPEASVLLAPCQVFRAREADVIRAARTRHAHAAIIVVSGFDDVARTHAALAAGAIGVLAEHELDEGLPAAVAAAQAGLTCLPASYRRAVARPVLTTREKQMLGMVILGLSNREIGMRLYLAESTVKSHLSSAFIKLGVRSRNEATARILDPASGLGPGILSVASRVTVRGE